MAKFRWWILLIVLSIAILTESTTTTKKPKSRKAPLNSPYKTSKRVQQPSGAAQPAQRSSAKPLAASQPGPLRPEEPVAAPSVVRRNPASLQSQSQDLGFEAVPVDRSRLKEDMAALGLTLDPADNNVNAIGSANTGNQQRPPARAPARTPARAPARAPARTPALRPVPAPNPYSDYEDLLFDEYDQPLQDNKLLAETASPTSNKFLKSEV